MHMRFGIDMGGTKTELVALDRHNEVRFRRRVATPQHGYRAAVETIANLVEDAEASLGVTGHVGVGCPGALCPASGRVKNANSTYLNGEAFGHDLSARLGRPVRIENDANCFVLSEARDGSGAGSAVVFGVIMGTGVGGGIAVHGQLLPGANRIAGEWGHSPLPWPSADEHPGPACYCGKRGCNETFLSGPGVMADHARSLGQQHRQPPGTGVADLARAAASGDAAARATLTRLFDRTARALSGVVNVLDPDVVVLGGGLSNLPGLCQAVTDRLSRYTFSAAANTRVVKATHGDASGVRGAAWLWDDV